MAPAWGSRINTGPGHNSWRWWLDQALAEVGRQQGGTRNRGSGRRQLLRFLVANGSQIGDGAHGRAEVEARCEAIAHG
jgi:hypothetical protein